MMDEDKILKLLDDYLGGSASADEKNLIDTHYASYVSKQPYMPSRQMLVRSKARSRRILRQALQQKPPVVFRTWPKISPITVYWLKNGLCTLLFGIGLYILFSPVSIRLREWFIRPLPSPASITLVQAQPGASKAALHFTDGFDTDLQPGETLIIDQTGVYYTSCEYLRNSETLAFAHGLQTISTPKGRQYLIILPDKSEVRLNPGSTLRFPFQFTGPERVVELAGEAYFSVKSPLPSQGTPPPFIVKTMNHEIRTIDAEFNVTAYQEDDSVHIASIHGPLHADRLLLIPGQQALFGKSGFITQVPLSDVSSLALKNGEFDFNHKTLPQVMHELARWYDLEVTLENEGQVQHLQMAGTFPRSMTIRRMLALLSNHHWNYRLEHGSKLIVFSQPTPHENAN